LIASSEKLTRGPGRSGAGVFGSAPLIASGAGGSVFGPAVARRIVGFFLASNHRYRTGTFPELTRREGEVLDLVAAGHRNSVIARTLDLSEKTVRNHLSSILLKLQVEDRSAAIVRAREAGLGRSDPET
jgi:DNA-binding NarL/FixJ family response regulator